MIAIDSDTGLPALPKRYFWRVRKVGGDKYADRLYICLRKRVWFWSIEVDYAMASQNEVWGPTMAHAIRARAGHLVKDNFAATKPDFSALLGDYPPKSLRTSSDAGGDS